MGVDPDDKLAVVAGLFDLVAGGLAFLVWNHLVAEVFEGGGVMRTPDQTVAVTPGSFVVHPPGELHEWITGPKRTLLFRVRYGEEFSGRTKEWPSNPDWKPRPQDIEYFAAR